MWAGGREGGHWWDWDPLDPHLGRDSLEEQSPESRALRVRVQMLTLIGCGFLGKSLNLSDPGLLHLQNRDNGMTPGGWNSFSVNS